ncbi:MAG: hypothetical protein M3Q36_01275 [bacterium]|nr:hypothetical protein [bacterium]
MKKLIIIATIVGVFSFSNLATANSPDPTSSPPSQTHWSSFSELNDIKIPDEILMDIQMEFQGFAVTKAAKVNRNDRELYQLRVDKSDIPINYDGFYLYFDRDWKFVEREDIQAPAPVFRSNPTNDNVDNQEDTLRTSEEAEEAEPIEDERPVGGSGGNDDDKPQPKPVPEPTPEPTPEPEPEPAPEVPTNPAVED